MIFAGKRKAENGKRKAEKSNIFRFPLPPSPFPQNKTKVLF